jgi:ribosomal protein L37AE/L43A
MLKLKRRVWCPKCHAQMLPLEGFDLKVWRCRCCKKTFKAVVKVEHVDLGQGGVVDTSTLPKNEAPASEPVQP